MQIPPYYDTEYGSDYDDLDFFLDDDFARRSLIGGECYLKKEVQPEVLLRGCKFQAI